MKLYTAKEINKKYKDKYVKVSQAYNYNKCEYEYEVLKVFSEIHEDTTLGQDVGTPRQYTR